MARVVGAVSTNHGKLVGHGAIMALQAATNHGTAMVHQFKRHKLIFGISRMRLITSKNSWGTAERAAHINQFNLHQINQFNQFPKIYQFHKINRFLLDLIRNSIVAPDGA